jgi:DnaK suppressor protein
MAISENDLRRLEELLLRDRQRTVRKLSRFAADFIDVAGDGGPGDRNPFTLHAAEQGTDAMEREKAFLLASEEGRRLMAIDEALRRLYTEPERFGRCERCGQEIGLARLEALPHATLCISCQVLQEAGGG